MLGEPFFVRPTHMSARKAEVPVAKDEPQAEWSRLNPPRRILTQSTASFHPPKIDSTPERVK